MRRKQKETRVLVLAAVAFTFGPALATRGLTYDAAGERLEREREREGRDGTEGKTRHHFP